MHNIIAPIISRIEIIIEHGGYTVLFLVSLLESLPVIGPLIPGHTIVILSGFLAKIGILDIWAVLAITITGAALSDITGYYLGKKFGFVFLTHFGKYLFIKDEHIEKVKKLVHNHTGKSIILGRFNPVTRPLAPFTVGASGVSLKRFILFDITGVLLWAVGSILLGYVFGASYHIIAASIGKFLFFAVVLSILIIWGYRIINKQFHIFAKYELIVLILNIIGLYGFLKTLQDALGKHNFMVALDVWVNVEILPYITSAGVFFMKIITNVFSPESLAVLVVLGTLYLLYKRQWRYSAISLASFGGGLSIGYFFKDLVMRIRPDTLLIDAHGYSFPSGHATAAAIIAVLAVYFFARKIENLILRETYIVSIILLAILVGVSRIYLGVHWLSDILAGFSLGVFWTTLVILGVRYVGLLVQSFRVK